jgi:hypothetical protein
MINENIVLTEEIRNNVHLVNNQKITYKNLDLFFSTLWEKSVLRMNGPSCKV